MRWLYSNAMQRIRQTESKQPRTQFDGSIGGGTRYTRNAWRHWTREPQWEKKIDK